MRSGRPRVPGVPASGRRDQDEDLLLFKEMFKREREHTLSLLQPVSDEFEPSQGNVHLYKIPSSKKRAETEEKNDYDWLKTPPATPLFPSLELEANENLANMVVHKELPILQPIKPSRFSSKNEVTKPTQGAKSPSSSSMSSSRSVTPRSRPMNSTSSKIHSTNQSRTNKSINSLSIPSTPMNTKEVSTKPTVLPEKIEVKQSINRRRFSCSPKMVRGIKNEHDEHDPKFGKMSIEKKKNYGSTNARRVTILNGEEKTLIKSQDDAGFAKFTVKSSLHRAFENLDEKRSEGVRSCNLVGSRTTKHRFSVENRAQWLKKKGDDKKNKFVMS